MDSICVNHLTKIYTGGKCALNDISFTLRQGEVFGFLGPNGAGKTTAVKLMNGMLTPSEGSCRVFDIDPSVNPGEMHKIAGVVTEHAQMYDKLTGFQNLVFYGNLFGIREEESKKRANELLDNLSLSDAANRKLETYSTGMRQRLSLARALIHRPKLLFLDEPTSGLDPESTQQVNKLIQRLAADEKITVFLCTHQLRYAQEICTSYGLIAEGMLLAAGTLEELRAKVFKGIIVEIEAEPFPSGIPIHNVKGSRYEIVVQSESEIPGIVCRIVEEGGQIYHVSAHQLTLEEIYFALISSKHEKKELSI